MEAEPPSTLRLAALPGALSSPGEVLDLLMPLAGPLLLLVLVLANAFFVLGEFSLITVEYVEHYNGHRPHRSLELRPPRGPTVIPAVTGGEVVRRTRAHGLINEYSRQAA